jgi:hypothetical protein
LNAKLARCGLYVTGVQVAEKRPVQHAASAAAPNIIMNGTDDNQKETEVCA